MQGVRGSSPLRSTDTPAGCTNMCDTPGFVISPVQTRVELTGIRVPSLRYPVIHSSGGNCRVSATVREPSPRTSIPDRGAPFAGYMVLGLVIGFLTANHVQVGLWVFLIVVPYVVL